MEYGYKKYIDKKNFGIIEVKLNQNQLSMILAKKFQIQLYNILEKAQL